MTAKEFSSQPSGTTATKIKYFDGDGNQEPSEYILKSDPDYDNEVEQAQEVTPGYFTERWTVTRK